jgi:hypothetical protein
MLRVLSLLFISTQIMASVPADKKGFGGNFDLGLNFTVYQHTNHGFCSC